MSLSLKFYTKSIIRIDYDKLSYFKIFNNIATFII